MVRAITVKESSLSLGYAGQCRGGERLPDVARQRPWKGLK